MFGRLTAVTLTAALTVTLTACDSNKSATPPPFTPSTAVPTASSTPSPIEVASTGAQDGYRKYMAAKVATAASGGTDTKMLSQVAIGTILASELNQATTYRGNKWRGVGQIIVVWTKAVKVGPVGSDGRVTAVTVQACYDSSKSTAVDANGKSIKEPGTPTRWLDEVDMRLDAGHWKASYGLNKGAKC